MKSERIIWGLILLAVGAVLLTENLGLIDFDWRVVFRLWPVAIILMGFNLLMPKHGIGRVVSLLVTVVAIAFLVYMGMTSKSTTGDKTGANDSRNFRRELRDRVRKNAEAD